MSRKGSPNVATKSITDDFGSRILLRRCSVCKSWRECRIGNFAPRKRDKETRRVLRWDHFCLPCRAAKTRERWASKTAEERLAIQRRRWQSLKADPERLRDRRESNRELMAERRKDPDLAERQRASSRAWYRRVKADPEAYAAYLEKARMNYRLRQEKAGRSLDEISEARSRAHTKADTRAKQQTNGGRVEVAPLLAFITEYASGRGLSLGETCDELGIEARSYFAWRDGERSMVGFDYADSIVSRAGAGWMLYVLYPHLDDAGLALAG